MPLIDLECTNGHVSEVMRALAEWPATPPCPACGASTAQIHLPPRTRWTIDPIVVFRAPDGSFRFPGDAGGTSATRYQRQGFERIELRSATDVRRFESAMNARERSRMARKVERRQELREEREAVTRSELRRLMATMSPRGRAVARAAMTRNDDKPRERTQDPNFHSEVLSFDRSNRVASRDEQGRRRRD